VTVEVNFLAALMLGLLGSVHCVGMCGGIAGALAAGTAARSQTRQRMLVLSYNVGRILSYMIAGALAGGFGGVAFYAIWPGQGARVGMLVAAVFMIALGLYLSGWWRVLTLVEQAGAVIWRRLEPAARRFLPVRRIPQALLVGAVWGWLPCGLVYSALTWSLASGSVTSGAILMGAFGIGTLPTVLAMGFGARWLARVCARPAVRRGAGLVLIAMGVYAIWAAMTGAHSLHSHHAA